MRTPIALPPSTTERSAPFYPTASDPTKIIALRTAGYTPRAAREKASLLQPGAEKEKGGTGRHCGPPQRMGQLARSSAAEVSVMKVINGLAGLGSCVIFLRPRQIGGSLLAGGLLHLLRFRVHRLVGGLTGPTSFARCAAVRRANKRV